MHIADKQITRNGIRITDFNGSTVYYDALDALLLCAWLRGKEQVLLHVVASTFSYDNDVHTDMHRSASYADQHTHLAPVGAHPPAVVEPLHPSPDEEAPREVAYLQLEQGTP